MLLGESFGLRRCVVGRVVWGTTLCCWASSLGYDAVFWASSLGYDAVLWANSLGYDAVLLGE